MILILPSHSAIWFPFSLCCGPCTIQVFSFPDEKHSFSPFTFYMTRCSRTVSVLSWNRMRNWIEIGLKFLPPTNCDVGPVNVSEPWFPYLCILYRINSQITWANACKALKHLPCHKNIQYMLANIITSILLPFPHFVLFLLVVICFVSDPNKMYCLNRVSALKRFTVLYPIILL